MLQAIYKMATKGPAYLYLWDLSQVDDIQGTSTHPLPVSDPVPAPVRPPVLASEFAPVRARERDPELDYIDDEDIDDDDFVLNPKDADDNLLYIDPNVCAADISTGIDEKRLTIAELESTLQRLIAKAQKLRAISDNYVVGDPNNRTDEAFIAANKASASVNNAKRWIRHEELEYAILLSCVEP